MISLLVLCIGLAQSVDPENIKIIQQQSAFTAESSLDGAMNRCLLNQFCQVGTAEGRLPEDSLASALYESYNVVNTVLQTSSRAHPMPNMQKIKSAFELGQKTRKVSLCSEVFECDNRDADIPIPNPASRKSIDCSNLAKVCPGLTISCSLCGLFIPGLCGAVCPMAGLFCGSSGYLCKLASGTNPEEEEMETTMSTDTTTTTTPATTSSTTTTTAAPRNAPRKLFDLEEEFAKYPQLNLDHIESEE